MRVSASFAVVLLCVAFLSINTGKAAAVTPAAPTIEHTAGIFEKLFGINIPVQEEEPVNEVQSEDVSQPELTPFDSESPTEEEPERKVVRHKIKPGDSLIAIAKKYDTSWKRIYAKNKQIKHPDSITAGEKLVIPDDDEKLKNRKVPKAPKETVNQPEIETRQAEPRTRPAANNEAAPAQRKVSRTSARSSSGNTYYAGYCTWYAKSRRPDLPNNLGNANTWVSRAAQQGIPTGSTPRAGAIGQQGMHVVYVEKVNKNGTVTVSEMNYEGFGVVSSRTVPASTFRYIY